VWLARHVAQYVSPSDLKSVGLTTDSNDLTATFAREFEYLESKVRKTEFAIMKGQTFVPFEELGGPEVNSQTYTMVTEVGQAAWGSNQSRTLPRVDVVGKEFSRQTDTIVVEWSVTVRELMQVAKSPRINLETSRKEAAVNAIARFHDAKALTGDTDKSWYGLINANSYVPLISPITGTWSTATPTQIIQDINKASWSVVSATKENHAPDTLLVPTSYGLILDTPIVSGSGSETVRSFILKNSSHIKNIDTCIQLETGNAAGNGPRAVLYKRDPNCVRYGAHAMYIEEPPQRQGFDIVVPCWGMSSGTQYLLPKAAAYMDGI
jgi:hypothetical protein